MQPPVPQQTAAASSTNIGASPAETGAARINSRDLLRQAREVEIDHDGRIYRLRLTQLNKLILTA